MSYIIKEVNHEETSLFKEFYVIETTTDINGESFQVAKLIGTYSKVQLESEIQMIDSQIESLNMQKADALEKIAMF